MKPLLSQLFYSILEKTFLLIGVFIVLWPLNPESMKAPFRDSGVFMYVGWRILNGEIPYSQVWDHKPPMVFFINALGLALSSESRWGIWVFEFIFLFSASLVGFYLIKKYFGVFATVVSYVFFVASLIVVIKGGNFTEEYALPFQFLCLWLAKDIKEKSLVNFRGILFGILLVLLLFIKQTTIGIGFSIFVYLIYVRISRRQFRELSNEFFMIFLGGLLISIVVSMYFILNGAFQDFISAAFLYNFLYVKNNLGSVILPSVMLSTGFLQIGLLVFPLVFARLLLKGKTVLSEDYIPLLIVGMISLPVELVLSNLGGSHYSHYYMSVLPFLFILSGYFFYVIFDVFSNVISSVWIRLGLLLMVVLGVVLFQKPKYDEMQSLYNGQRIRPSYVAVIDKYTTPEDTLLIWGAEAGMNFMVKRASPSRFAYLYPLYNPEYGNADLVNEFVDAIISKQPLILDTHSTDMPMLQFPYIDDEIQTKLDFLKSHYVAVRKFSSGYTIYKFEESVLQQ